MEEAVLKERVSSVLHSLRMRDISPIEAYEQLSDMDSKSKSILELYRHFQQWVCYGGDLTSACKRLVEEDNAEIYVSNAIMNLKANTGFWDERLRNIMNLILLDSPLLNLLCSDTDVSISRLTEDILNLHV